MTENYLPDENFTRLSKKKKQRSRGERRKQRKLEMQRKRENTGAKRKGENLKNHEMTK